MAKGARHSLVTVTDKKLEHYLGKPQFTKDRIYGTYLSLSLSLSLSVWLT
jgi:hypothetical protein